MATQAMQKTTKQEEPTNRRGTLAPYRGFPFALSRIRDEFDRLWDRFTGGPSLLEADNWRWGLEVEDEDNAVIVRAESTGFEAGDFDVQVSDGRLVLSLPARPKPRTRTAKPASTVNGSATSP